MWSDGTGLREARSASARELPVILVWEEDEQKGGMPLQEMISDCPDDLKVYVFGPGSMKGGKSNKAAQRMGGDSQRLNPVIPWHRVSHFQRAVLKEIAKQILLASPYYGL